MMTAAVVAALVAAVAGVVAALVEHFGAREVERTNDRLRAESMALRRANTLDRHATEAIALTLPTPQAPAWITPTAFQLAEWATRPGYDWRQS